MEIEKLPYAELIKRLEACPAYGSKWRHYKNGHTYAVTDRVIHEATQEPLVVYIDLDDPGSCRMARPLAQWEEEVEHEGQKVKRFTRIV